MLFQYYGAFFHHGVSNEWRVMFGLYRSTLNAIQYLHDHDIVHRDLKYVSVSLYVQHPAANNNRPENQTAISLSLILACNFSPKSCNELKFYTPQFLAQNICSPPTNNFILWPVASDTQRLKYY
jgi:serine/threonine protein kinase